MTLRELSQADQMIFFLCGTDMLLTLDTWRNADEVMRLAAFTVVSRENDPKVLDMMYQKKQELTDRFGAKITILNAPAYPASSTEIRKAIAEGQSIDRLVPLEVGEYMQRWNLYRK